MSERSTPVRVLVIDDEPDIAAVVVYEPAHSGFAVRTAGTGSEAIRAIEMDPPDLVILDLLLPEMSGLDVLRALKVAEETRALPIVVLTARGEEEDRIKGLELGADDYVTKPLSPRELVLGIEAVLRRARVSHNGSATARRPRVGRISVDPGAQCVTVDGEEIRLSRKEYQLLICLMQRRGRTQSRKALLEAVWNTTADIETRTVDMHVPRLRMRLGDAAGGIETVRGFGYRFEAEP